MEPLVAGIFQCPQCKKIIKQKDKETESRLPPAEKRESSTGVVFYLA
jgi:hypothetical protein